MHYNYSPCLQLGQLVGSDMVRFTMIKSLNISLSAIFLQYLSILLTITSLFNVSPSLSDALTPKELGQVTAARKKIMVLLNRYLRLKFGPKKASSKVYQLFLLKRLN